jgi:hypothetical protein
VQEFEEFKEKEPGARIQEPGARRPWWVEHPPGGEPL